MTLEQFRPFACSVCGRPMRTPTARGECRSGYGCRAGLDQPERFRRFWLTKFGVDEREIRAVGGAIAYVREFGLPEDLHAIVGVMPRDAELVPRAEIWVGIGYQLRTVDAAA